MLALHVSKKTNQAVFFRFSDLESTSANKSRMGAKRGVEMMVNAAYTSQRCPEPDCGYVHKDNRNGDMFHCHNPYWNCNWQGGADKVAAMNLMARASDREITLYTPYRDLKNLLDMRFQRRLESRTGDAGVSMETVSDAVLTRVTEGDTTAWNRTPSEPRQKCLVGGTNGVDSQSPVLTVGIGETQRLGSENKRMASYLERSSEQD